MHARRMGARSRRPARLLVIVATITQLAGAASTAGGTAPPRIVYDEEIGVVVPAPGITVWAQTLEADGDTDVLVVTTLPDGTVLVRHRGEDGVASDAAAAATDLPACQDPAFTPYSHVVKGTYRWRFNSSSVPSTLSSSKVTGALKRAASNVTGTQNDCSLPDAMGAGQTYDGTSSAAPNVSSSSVCRTRDEQSVVGFGDLAASNIAYACWWTSGGAVVEADVKMNKVDFDWTISPGKSCRGKFAVEAAMTHEFGHVFGLDHVDEGLHGNLTMSPLIDPCQLSEATLGAGDVAGLAVKYAA